VFPEERWCLGHGTVIVPVCQTIFRLHKSIIFWPREKVETFIHCGASTGDHLMFLCSLPSEFHGDMPANLIYLSKTRYGRT
jgi:hypothetical protein